MSRLFALAMLLTLSSLGHSGEIRFANGTANSFRVFVRPQSQSNWVAKTGLLQPNTETNPFTLPANAYIVHLEFADGTGQNSRPMRLGHLADTTIKINATMETRNAEVYRPVKMTRADGSVYYQVVTEQKTMTVEVLVLVDDTGAVVGNVEKKGPIVPRDSLGLTLAQQQNSVVVTEVTPNSPAASGKDDSDKAMSLRTGDRIEYINGKKVNTVDDFVTEVKEGQTDLSIVLQRQGGQMVFQTSLVGHIKQFNAKMYACDKGLHISAVLDPNQQSQLRFPDGSIAGLEPGDHILSIDGQPADSVDRLFSLCNNSPNDLEVLVLDKDGKRRWNLVFKR